MIKIVFIRSIYLFLRAIYTFDRKSDHESKVSLLFIIKMILTHFDHIDPYIKENGVI